MASIIQFLKMLLSGRELRGIRFRSILSIIVTIAVLALEIVVFYTQWDTIPDMIKYDYNFSGIANDMFEKKWIWYNLLFQMFICAFVFIVKKLLYKTKRVHNIVFDKNNRVIPILDRRFSMFALETAMLFVTTEQGYIFGLIDIVNEHTCDVVVTAVFLFWMLILVIEFFTDIRALRTPAKTK